jgi:hypothetical protein
VNNGSTPRRYDDAVVELLARGASQVEAARGGPVSARTVRRRQGDPAFVERVRARRAELVEEAGSRAAGLAARAVDAMGDCLDSDSPAVKLRAAQLITDLARRISVEAALDDRIGRLEPTPPSSVRRASGPRDRK